jgi:hypothetical protein
MSMHYRHSSSRERTPASVHMIHNPSSAGAGVSSHRAELPYPCVQESWRPASPRMSRFCLCNRLQILDRKSCSMRSPTPRLRTPLNLDLSGSSTVECHQAFLSE